MKATHQADYSPERRARAVRYAREVLRPRAGELTPEAQLMAIVGTLVCNTAGRIDTEALAAAWQDPSVRQVASSILDEAWAP